MKKKYIFLGDIDSINIELIAKSHKILKNKVKYILIGNKVDLSNYLKKISSKIRVSEVLNPLDFSCLNSENLNIFNVDNISDKKYINLINQIKISNYLSSINNLDLITLPINKSLFKKKINFVGMTEFLGEINKTKTIMLMRGNCFSIIPITTHINLKDVSKFVNINLISSYVNEILSQTEKAIYNLKFNKINFLCYNPHCSENNLLGNEDQIILKSISEHKKIKGPISADSAFRKIQKNTLFISMYHDQALIPFKILNKKSINLTLGLNYRRLSPSHGTAENIKFKNCADNSSYIECMNF